MAKLDRKKLYSEAIGRNDIEEARYQKMARRRDIVHERLGVKFMQTTQYSRDFRKLLESGALERQLKSEGFLIEA